MATYIDIDRREMTIDGELATEREMIRLANKLYSEPGRYLCLFRSDMTGQYRYANFQGTSVGDGAVHPAE